jgi:hypothetical protein
MRHLEDWAMGPLAAKVPYIIVFLLCNNNNNSWVSVTYTETCKQRKDVNVHEVLLINFHIDFFRYSVAGCLWDLFSCCQDAWYRKNYFISNILNKIFRRS